MKKYNVVTSISYPKVGAMGKTGSWRVFRPTLDKKKCVKCLRCWIFCPESAIHRNKDDTVSIDEDGMAEFDIDEVGDNQTFLNLTFWDYYDEDCGNCTAGTFWIEWPDFILDPDTAFIGQANMITITALDYDGAPIEHLNLTFYRNASFLPGT